jgi:RNA polymerase sigma-70 factor (ECF subfamily)
MMTEGEHTRRAFEVLVEPHLRTLFRLARRLVRQDEEAADLVQETCLKAFRALHQFRPGSNGKAWLVTILLNTARDWARKAGSVPPLLCFDEVAEFVRPVGTAPDPEEVAVQTNLGYLVRLALDDLPPEFRLVVLLADVEGFAYREIADMVGCPIGTVMSRLHRGRRLLRTTLQEFIEE